MNLLQVIQDTARIGKNKETGALEPHYFRSYSTLLINESQIVAVEATALELVIYTTTKKFEVFTGANLDFLRQISALKGFSPEQLFVFEETRKLFHGEPTDKVKLERDDGCNYVVSQEIVG